VEDETKCLVDTISEYQFSNEMIKHGFSYEGSKALFEYYEEFEEDIPFDPVAIRCDFTEYENFEAVQKDYKDIETLDQLRGNTIVYEVPNTKKLVIMNY
jgi:hypothetical protein